MENQMRVFCPECGYEMVVNGDDFAVCTHCGFVVIFEPVYEELGMEDEKHGVSKA
jgi:DNA-directed RNA polymerase subunit RPC12/RpoP